MSWEETPAREHGHPLLSGRNLAAAASQAWQAGHERADGRNIWGMPPTASATSVLTSALPVSAFLAGLVLNP